MNPGVDPLYTDIIVPIIVAVISVLLGALLTYLIEKNKRENQYKDKYWEKQMSFYLELWPALAELKSASDDLWAQPTIQKILVFFNIVERTDIELRKNKLLLDDSDFSELQDLLLKFKPYAERKLLLVTILNNFDSFISGDLDLHAPGSESAMIRYDFEDYKRELHSLIRANSKTKELYDAKIREIENRFRAKLTNRKSYPKSWEYMTFIVSPKGNVVCVNGNVLSVDEFKNLDDFLQQIGKEHWKVNTVVPMQAGTKEYKARRPTWPYR